MEQSFQSRPVTRPKNWLAESILVTIFCCLPFGIVGIVYASQVNNKFAAGDFEGAEKSSQEAGKWTKIGFFIGVAILVLYIIAFMFFGFALFKDKMGNMESI